MQLLSIRFNSLHQLSLFNADEVTFTLNFMCKYL